MEADWEREPDYDALVRAHRMMGKTPTQGLSELKALAARGSPMSMLYVGAAYALGQGVAVNLTEAITWFRRAADAGCVRAYYNFRIPIPKDKQYAAAKEAFEVGSAQDFAPAIHMLGKIYFFGYGVDKDFQKAKPLLERASARGSVFAKRLLAYQLMHGHEGWIMEFKRRVDANFLLHRYTSDSLHRRDHE